MPEGVLWGLESISMASRATLEHPCLACVSTIPAHALSPLIRFMSAGGGARLFRAPADTHPLPMLRRILARPVGCSRQQNHQTHGDLPTPACGNAKQTGVSEFCGSARRSAHECDGIRCHDTKCRLPLAQRTAMICGHQCHQEIQPMDVAQLAQGWLWNSFSPPGRDRIERDDPAPDASNAQLRSSFQS